MSQTIQLLRKYRATFILDSRETAEELDASVERVKELLVNLGCEITKTENHGTKDFIRVTDRRKPNGIYLEIVFDADPKAPAEIQSKFSFERNVKRVLIQLIA